jgi:hypothetical protein
MAVTVQITGGPSVRLRYQPGRGLALVQGRAGRPYRMPVVPWTTVAVRNQTAAWHLADVLEAATALLVLYAGEEPNWPAELRTPCSGKSEADEHS